MKLSKNAFCYTSSRWTDGVAYNEAYLQDATAPAHKSWDAKAAVFSTLVTNQLKMQVYGGSNDGGTMTLTFSSAATVQNLMTTNDVPFATYPDWTTWKDLFGSDRYRAPVFVRAGQVILTGSPCRTSGGIAGCGQPCMFCMQAGDGSGCPTYAAHNDISSGVGNNANFCGGGRSDDCSTSGEWQGTRRTLVWAKVM